MSRTITESNLSNFSNFYRKVIEVYDRVKADDLEIYPFIEWENMALIDIAFPVNRVGILVDGETIPEFDIRSVDSKLEAQKWAMEANGWSVFVVNFGEFKEGGVEYINDLRQNLKDVSSTSFLTVSRRTPSPSRRKATRTPFSEEGI